MSKTTIQAKRKDFLYSNAKQIQFLNSKAKTKAFVGGRGTGKSFVAGLQTALRVGELPGALFGLVGPTFTMLKNNTIPSFIEAVKRCGFQECKDGVNGHFVKFKSPPKFWDKPFQEVADYDNLITFSNGYTVELISWHNIEVVRGKNLDGLDIDEAALFPKDKFDKVLMPTVRANSLRELLTKSDLHHQICFYTSYPWSPNGNWVLDYEKQAEKHPDKICFITSTSWDNVEVLGEETLKRWRREMSPLEYKVEIMCQDIGRVPNAFYDSFDELKHTYITPANAPLNDIDPERELYASFDFNAGFICCIVGQCYADETRIVKELFVKGNGTLNSLVERFAQTFRFMQNREVIIKGDRAGNNKQVASQFTIYEQIEQHFKEQDFNPKLESEINYADHQLKYEVINKAFQGRNNAPRLQISRRGCPNLCINLIKTPILLDFRKDKSSEKSSVIPQEQATHLSDAFDYLVFPLYEALILGKQIEQDSITFL